MEIAPKSQPYIRSTELAIFRNATIFVRVASMATQFEVSNATRSPRLAEVESWLTKRAGSLARASRTEMCGLEAEAHRQALTGIIWSCDRI
jgi:hypothetical protein